MFSMLELQSRVASPKRKKDLARVRKLRKGENRLRLETLEKRELLAGDVLAMDVLPPQSGACQVAPETGTPSSSDAGGMNVAQGVQGAEEPHVAEALSLTPADQANFVTAKSGEWSNPCTWLGGEVPTENGQVLIAEGHTVLFDTVQQERTEWVRVDGTLQFDHTTDTHLYVETLVVGVSGELTIGTTENPIDAGVTARVTIADAGEDFDHSVDMQELGRGIIALGRVEMHGADVTSYSGLAKQPMAGDTEFVLDGADGTPVNWKVGDRLVITGNEIVYITGISQNDAGQTVVAFDKDLDVEGVQGLARNHTAPEGYGLTHYVGNLDRNVVIESENQDIINRRGHVMFMQNQNVEIHNAGFYGLGRTDKGKLINDVSTDSNGNQVPGTNVRGRYSVHFHRAGTSTDATPGHVEGSVVMDNPGWGYVNHDSYVNMVDNIAYHVKGAAFAQELGNERGTFTRNLAINTYGGTGNWRTPIPDRQPLYDWGFAGHGFWLHSPSVSMIDNIAAASNESGFAYFGKGSGGGGSLTNFIGNTNIGGKVAMLSWKFSRPQIVFEDFTVWNTGGVLYTQDYSNITFKDSLFVKNVNNPSGQVVGSAYGGGLSIKHYNFDNTTIVGWAEIRPTYPINTFVVNGGYYNNLNSFAFGVGNATRPRFDNVQFGELSSEVLNGRTQSHISFLPGLGLETPDFRKMFMSTGVGVMIDGQQLYRYEQAPDYVNFTHGGVGTPDQFVGKTNQQLLDEYGVAPGGAIAPADAMHVPGFHGLLGAPSADSALATLLSREFTNNLDGYLLSFRTADGQVITETEPTAPLREGWNAITRDVDGVKQTVFVFGDITPPVFQEAEGYPGRIERSVDYSVLHEAFRFGTRVADVPMGSQKIGFTLRGLNTTPIEGSVQQGNVYVTRTIGFTDWAGNSATAEVRVYIKNYPRPPIAWGDTASVTINTPTVINVLKNDYDRDLDPLTIISVSDPQHGTVVVNDNQVTYTPDADYTGKDSFNYTISDGKGGTAQAAVNITVAAAATGAPPVAEPDIVDRLSGTGPVTIDVLANDTDPDGDTLTIESLDLSLLNFGTVEQVGNQLVYTPIPDLVWADDGFFYTISDGNGNTSRAIVGIRTRPNPENIAPNAVDDVYSTGFEEVLNVLDGGVLANDSDSNGDSLTASLAREADNGSVTVNADGSFSYTPDAGFSGVDSFTYTVNDNNGGFSTATVNITVEAGPVNNVPEALDDVFTTAYGEVLNILDGGVLANDSDVDGDSLSTSLASGPANGSVTLNADGSFSYTPDAGFSGVDSFTYTADDGNGGLATATVEITVEAESDDVVTDVATSSSTRFGTASGSHLDTHEADGTSQTITEQISGKRRNRRSVMEHSWTFDVNGGDVVTFHATAGHNSSVETFRFDYNDGSGWKPLFTLTSQEMTSYSATLPASTRGTVTVRVIDTNRARKEMSLDTVQIDAMHFRSEGSTTRPELPEGAFLATGDTSVRGYSSGTLANGGSQTLTEQVTGKRRNRRSTLEHRWTFDLTGQTNLDFVVDAEHLSSSDPDDFQFQYSLDGGQTWEDLLTVTITSGGQSVAVNLPEGTSEVTVRVTDTHHAKDGSRASLRIDEMYFRAT